MTTTLLNDVEGRSLLLIAQRQQLQDRLARFFRRNVQIDYDNWAANLAEFDLPTTVDDLNDHHDTELRNIYRLLGTIGGLPESISDVTVYIDPTGSDTNGTGSAARPYASLWFLSTLPRVIRHTLNIVFTGDATVTNLHIDVSFKDSGCLNFVGRGAVTEVFPGSSLAGLFSFQNTWYQMTTVAAPAPAYLKTFVQMTSGGDVGHAAGVCRVDAANFRMFARWLALVGSAVPDSFRLIVPTHTLTVERATITGSGAWDIGDAQDVEGSRINFVNLNIDIPGSVANTEALFVTRGVPMGFWFVRMLLPEEAKIVYPPVVFRNEINRWNPVTGKAELATLANTNVTNLFHGSWSDCTTAGLHFVTRESGIDEYSWSVPIVGLDERTKMYCVDAMGAIWVTGQRSDFLHCSAKHLYAYNSGIEINSMALDPNDAAANYCARFLCCRAYVKYPLFGTAVDGMDIENCMIRFGPGGGDAAGTMTALSGYGMRIRGLSNVYKAVTWNGTSGAVNDIIFDDPAVPLAGPWPAVSTLFTDALGNNVLKGP